MVRHQGHFRVVDAHLYHCASSPIAALLLHQPDRPDHRRSLESGPAVLGTASVGTERGRLRWGSELGPGGCDRLLSWPLWFIRRYWSHHHYRETVNDFRCTTSLVVPVYREDPEVLQRCLTTWLAEKPDEIILVVDDRDDLLLKFLDDLELPTVRIVPWRHTGKRGALGVGVCAWPLAI